MFRITCASLVFALCSVARAEAPTALGRIELTGFGGANAGLPGLASTAGNVFAPLRTVDASERNWTAGGGIGVAIRRNFLLVGEVSGNSLGSIRTVVAPPLGVQPFSLRTSANIVDLTLGLHYQIPVRSSRTAPYAAGAVGVANLLNSVSDEVPGGNYPAVSVAVGQGGFTANAGGGVRFYLTNRFGIRPEFKVVRIPHEVYVRGSFGLFYQFRK